MSAERIDALAERLRPHYSRFLAGAGKDVLMTGHSHQAWPDVSREAQIEAWDTAASLIDGKWDCIFGELVPELQRLVAKRIGSSRPKDIAIAPSTHELVYRLLSCFDPGSLQVLSTDHEFHSLRRQLARLEEDGVKVVRLPGLAPDLAERAIRAIESERPTLIALSLVLFTCSRVIVDLPRILEAADRARIPVLVDAYHAFNAIPLEIDRWPGTVFVTAGGYKYAQTGEGASWMLLPEDASRFRPRSTGWFSDFENLESPAPTQVRYGEGGSRFLGATLDPTGIFRCRRVLSWMDAQDLSVPVLRAQSILQTQRLIERYDSLNLTSRGLGLATPRNDPERGAFVSFEHPRAVELSTRLRAAGVRTDARTPYLRFGPAPYTTSAEIDRAVDVLASVL